MDITPLYELRTRLRAAMIAGTNLLSEDFRLKRAAEAMEPLEQASPVFAKIGQLTRALLAPEQPDREGALLDTITLVDAVICTQGAVSVTEEIEPVQGSHWGKAVTNAPYSIISTLLNALLNSGSGHYNYVVDTHKEHPELFQDYRIKAAMVQALGASYSELAEQVTKWLKEEDTSILPLLQDGFDPRGKKEMIRRIQVMEAIDAKESNEFFRKVLPESEKEVRQAIIFALRHCPENVDLLIELTKTEKGNMRKMAYYALAYMEDERAEAIFRALYRKKPGEAMQYLVFVETGWASRLVAESLKEQLLPWTEGAKEAPEHFMSEEQSALLEATLKALPGKSGEEICEVFRMAEGLGDGLKYPFADRKKVWVGTVSLGRYSQTYTFRAALPIVLMRALHIHPGDGISELAIELYEKKDKKSNRYREYFSTAVTAMLSSGEDCCDWLKEQLDKDLYPYLTGGIEGLRFNEHSGTYEMRMPTYNLAAPFVLPDFVWQVKQEITGRFTDILMQCKEERIDAVLRNCINVQDTAYCRKLEEYFYKRALTTPKDNRPYLDWLKNCGCRRCDGLAVHYFGQKTEVAFWEISSYANNMPGDGSSRYEEIKKVYDMIKSGRIKMRSNKWGMNEESFLEFLESLKHQP